MPMGIMIGGGEKVTTFALLREVLNAKINWVCSVGHAAIQVIQKQITVPLVYILASD